MANREVCFVCSGILLKSPTKKLLLCNSVLAEAHKKSFLIWIIPNQAEIREESDLRNSSWQSCHTTERPSVITWSTEPTPSRSCII